MELLKKYARQWKMPHVLCKDSIEDGVYIKERRSLGGRESLEHHRWIEKWKPVKKKVVIDNQEIEIDGYIHTLIYEDKFNQEEESEFVTIPAKKIVESIINIALAYAERGFKNQNYKDIKHIYDLAECDDLDFIKLTKRTID